MNDIQEQYEKELINQEIKSNKHTLKGFAWFFLATLFIWVLNMVGIFEVDKKLITIAFISTFLLSLPAVIFYFKGDLSKPWVKYFFLSLICIASSVIISFLSYHAVLLYVVPLLFAIQYRRQSTIWFVYIVNTFTMIISSLISFYYGICDLNILLQSQHVRNWYLDVITDSALNIPFNENPVFVIIVFEVFPRSIILLVFSIMMKYTMVSSNEDAHKIAQLTYLKETDTKTRVFNKNKYEEMVKEYYPEIENVTVLFWDLNNLKSINDLYGHAMGDKAIGELSSALNKYSTENRRVYRIGGDEFLVIIDNPSENEAEKIISDVKTILQNVNYGAEIKISSAVGSASGKGKDILEIVKKADADMYRNKKSGKEGRK